MNARHLLVVLLFIFGFSSAMAQQVPQTVAAPATPSATPTATPAATPPATVTTSVTTVTTTMPAQAQAPAPAASNAFLSDYTRLSPSLSSRNDFQSYTPLGAAGRQLGRVYIMPVTSFPENAQFEYIDRATLSALESKFYSDLSTALNEKIILVSNPEQADTIIQMAITGVTADEPNRKLIDFMPLRLITKPVKDATMGKEQEVLVTLEMKIRNVKTNQTLFESLDRAKGKTMGRMDDQNLHADIKELQPVVETWTKRISKSISSLQSGR